LPTPDAPRQGRRGARAGSAHWKILRAPPRDGGALRRVLGDPAHLGHQLVAAHPDAAAHLGEVDLDAMFGEGEHPGVRVGVIAVDEGAVDVEEHCLSMFQTTPNSQLPTPK
jgi:hypothetical protein